MIRIYIYWPKQPDGRGYCPAPVLATCRDALNLDLLDFTDDWQSIRAEDRHGFPIGERAPTGTGLWCFEAKIKDGDADPVVLAGCKWRRLGKGETDALAAGTLGRQGC